MRAAEPVHGSAVAWGRNGVLLLGGSGSGKSSLALSLIDRGGLLIGDDRLWLETTGDTVLAWPPFALQGLIEVRGLSPVQVSFRAPMPVRLVARLVVSPADVPRWPAAEGEPDRENLLDTALPVIYLAYGDVHAPARLAAALTQRPSCLRDRSLC